MKKINRKKFPGASAVSAVFALLIGVSCLGSAAVALSNDPPLDRFETSIKAFENRDKTSVPKVGSTIFVGSSTFAHWKTLESDLSDCNAINRGFGGSTIPEVNHYVDRIVINYKPSRIVFYAGTNDIAEGHGAKRVFDDFAEFVIRVHSALPHTSNLFHRDECRAEPLAVAICLRRGQ